MDMPLRYLHSVDSLLKYRSFKSACWEGAKPDGSSLPIKTWASNEPRNVLAGRRVFNVRWGKPLALLENTSALNWPGPHQIFSVEIPNSKAPALSRKLDWPHQMSEYGLRPNRSGWSPWFQKKKRSWL